MTYSLIRESWPVARKVHKCIWCGEAIPAGVKHRHEISRYYDLQDHRWHLECNADAQKYFASGEEEEFEPYNADRPKEEPPMLAAAKGKAPAVDQPEISG